MKKKYTRKNAHSSPRSHSKQRSMRVLFAALIWQWVVVGGLSANQTDNENIADKGSQFFVTQASSTKKNTQIDNTKSYSTLYAIAFMAEKKKDFARAIAYYKAAGNKKPNGNAYGRLSVVYYQINDKTNARIMAQKSIKTNPSYLIPYFVLASIAQEQGDYQKAIDFYEQALSLEPDNIKARFLLAKLYQQLRNDSKTKRNLIHIIHVSQRKNIDTRYLEYAYLYLARGFMYAKNNKLANHFLTSAYNTNPGNMNTLLLLASLNWDMLRLQDAKSYYEKLHNYFPDNDQVTAKLAEIHFLLGNDKEANKYTKQSLFKGSQKGSQNIDPQNINAMKDYAPIMMRGLYYFLGNDTNKAFQIFSRILQKDYRNITAHYALSRIFAQSNKNDKNKDHWHKTLFTSALLFMRSSAPWKAETNLRFLVQSNPDEKKYRYQLARFYELNERYYSAILQFKKLLAQDPKNLKYKLHLAYLYGITKQFAKSHTHFHQMIQKYPTNSQLHYFHGLVYYKENRFDLAKNALTKALSYQKSANYQFHLAAAYEKLGHLEKAIELLKMIIEKKPEHGRAYNFLGYLYADHNRNLDDASELIMKAIEFDPENPAYQDSLGWLYYRQGKLIEAQQHVQLAIKYFRKEKNTDPVVYDHLGDILLKKGNFGQAVKAWQKSLAIYNKENKKKDDLYFHIENKVKSTQRKMKNTK